MHFIIILSCANNNYFESNDNKSPEAVLDYCIEENRISSIFGQIDVLGTNAPLICFECKKYSIDPDYEDDFYKNILFPNANYIFKNNKKCDQQNKETDLHIYLNIGVEATLYKQKFDKLYMFIQNSKETTKECTITISPNKESMEFMKNNHKSMIEFCLKIIK